MHTLILTFLLAQPGPSTYSSAAIATATYNTKEQCQKAGNDWYSKIPKHYIKTHRATVYYICTSNY